jgi:transcriptional regulator of NAD metabolism
MVTPKSQKAAQRQLRHEHQHNEAQHLCQVLGSAQRGAISHIEVAQGDMILEVTGQEDVKRYRMEMCEAQFPLMENTPPMTAPLLSNLGFMVMTMEARQILEGTYEPPPKG